MMLTPKDAKTMAKSLRDALGNRSVLLSHSECLEIVARQFGLANWNTLVAKLSDEEQRAESRSTATTLPVSTSARTPSPSLESVSAPPLSGAETQPKHEDAPKSTQATTPWGPCSFCGKAHPEVRILLGGCGGWEGFRARRNPESGERSNAFICNECIALCAQIATRRIGGAADSQAI